MGKKERKKAKEHKGRFGQRRPSCLDGFVRLCNDGWLQGWHERNGGNLSYRLAPHERNEFEGYAGFGACSDWHGLTLPEPSLAGEQFLVTGSGRHMRRVADDPSANLCLIELDGEGASWRLLWGLTEGGMLTSELPTHLAAHAVRSSVGEGRDRVVYHAHLPNLVALTYVAEPEDRTVSRILWKTIPECVMTFPEGVGVVGWGIPGGRSSPRPRAPRWSATARSCGRSTACSARGRPLTRRSVTHRPWRRPPRFAPLRLCDERRQRRLLADHPRRRPARLRRSLRARGEPRVPQRLKSAECELCRALVRTGRMAGVNLRLLFGREYPR